MCVCVCVVVWCGVPVCARLLLHRYGRERRSMTVHNGERASEVSSGGEGEEIGEGEVVAAFGATVFDRIVSLAVEATLVCGCVGGCVWLYAALAALLFISPFC